MKLEEREVMIRKITSQCEELQRENNRVLVENGRLVDVVSALEAALVEVKTHTAREMDFLAPRVEELESKAEALAREIQKNTLDIDMMSGLVVLPCLDASRDTFAMTLDWLGTEAPKNSHRFVIED